MDGWTKQHVPGVKAGHELCWLKIVNNNEVQAYLLLTVYHPPKPVYNVTEYIERLRNDVDELSVTYPTSILIDLTYQLLVDCGFVQVNTTPTRGRHVLDVFITNRIDLIDSLNCCC